MRRVLKIVLGLLLACILAVGALFASIFIDKMPVEDGKILNGHGVTVDDGFSSAFLLPAGDGLFALVDCTNDAGAVAVQEALKKRGASSDAVVAIFLTHGHPDHIAGCNQFKKAIVYAFGGDAPMIQGSAASSSPMGRLTGIQTEKTAHVGKILKDGEELIVGDLTVRAFSVPGHTSGSGAYLVRGVLYMGDSAKVKKDGSLANTPWLFSENLDQNSASVRALGERLKGEQIGAVAFSHTGPLSSAVPLTQLK